MSSATVFALLVAVFVVMTSPAQATGDSNDFTDTDADNKCFPAAETEGETDALDVADAKKEGGISLKSDKDGYGSTKYVTETCKWSLDCGEGFHPQAKVKSKLTDGATLKILPKEDGDVKNTFDKNKDVSKDQQIDLEGQTIFVIFEATEDGNPTTEDGDIGFTLGLSCVKDGASRSAVPVLVSVLLAAVLVLFA